MEHPLPPSPIALHTRCTTRYPTSLYGTPPPPLPHSTAHRAYYTVPHQPFWNTPSPPLPQHCTPGVLHGTPPAFMEHPPPPSSTALHTGRTTWYLVPHQPFWNTPSPLPHSTAHQVYYTVPHQPLWNIPRPPSPTALHTGCTTRYPTSLSGTPPPPLPHSTAHQVYYTVPHQPLSWAMWLKTRLRGHVVHPQPPTSCGCHPFKLPKRTLRPWAN